VSGFIADVRRRAKNGSLPKTQGTCVMADLGCGDAKLAQTLVGKREDVKVGGCFVRVHSFDLCAESELVTAADIAHLPLAAGSIDVAVFCLALMGTNWPSFIDESWRVLRDRGELWVAEIKSRFARVGAGGKDRKKIGDVKESQKDKESKEAEHDAILAVEVDGQTMKQDTTDVSAFVSLLKAHGFDLAGSEKESIDLSNKMFVKMRFVKIGNKAPSRGKNADGVAAPVEEQRYGRVKKKKRYLEEVGNVVVPEEEEARILKPCVYKLR